jgi:flagellar basal-body rod protein FlgF
MSSTVQERISVERGQRSNDPANPSTSGYKADNAKQAGLADLLFWNSNTGAAIGSLSMGSRVTRVVTDLSQTPLRKTGGPLDIALDGYGFLAVSTGSGVRYTRDGQLVIDGDGRLATDTGDLVLGTSGSPITVGQVCAPSQISIDSRGSVKVGARTVGTLAVMSLTGATKQGDSLFTGAPGVRPPGTTVRQGFVEGSEPHRRRGTSA